MAEALSTFAGPFRLHLEGSGGAFNVTLTSAQVGEQQYLVTLSLSASTAAPAPDLKLTWRYPSIDIQAAWHPGIGRNRTICTGVRSRAGSNAPVICLHNRAGRNRMTIACSDVLNSLDINVGSFEEMGEAGASIHFFRELMSSFAQYRAEIRFDLRDIPYHEALGAVSQWWQKDYPAAVVPALSREPMYSTWYSFFQAPDPILVREQARLAHDAGCGAIILDDGWQMTKAKVGYSYTGDWNPERVGDMKAYVQSIHDMGMKFLMWYSVPHVGKHAKILPRFKDKIISTDHMYEAFHLDPRFPEVRAYIIETYERGLREWNLDGFKLDFVENITPDSENARKTGDGRDYDSVSEATVRLLKDVHTHLTAIKPDILIEFRQTYIGPLMRTCSNIFRAVDCPNDAMTNRIRTLDVRLLSGNTTVHSDMFMWHPNEPVEAAALQILDILFSVPQISVRFDQLPADHRLMLRHYLGFWRAHRDVLLDGVLEPTHPEHLYPVVRSSTDKKRVLAVYDDAVAEVGGRVPATLLLINATRGHRLVAEFAEALLHRTSDVYDCLGNLIDSQQRSFAPGVHAIDVPPSGYVAIH